MSHLFRSKIAIENHPELSKFEIALSAPLSLEIITPSLLSAEATGQLLYSLYHKLNYLFAYLNYQIKITEKNPQIDKNTIQEYFFLIWATPFFWKNKNDLLFFCQQEKSLTEFVYQSEDNTVCWNFAKKGDLEIWQPKIAALKEILNKLGLTNIRFSLRKKNGNNHSTLPLKSPTEKAPKKILVQSSTTNNQLFPLPPEWKERKIFELGIHTKFSTLDGISNAADYVKSARAKNYAALAITDHYNVQIFPEFSQEQTEDLRIIYGCELEMLEDDLPPYIFNHNSATNQKLLTVPITALTYCVFDLETTGFFAAYNEIIEIGYVIYQNGKIIREGEYLVCPEKPIAPEILANWYTDIDPKELKKAPKINQILPRLKKEWENCVLVAHNARNFDYPFLSKVWKKHLGEELPYPVIDTLPLAWILLPERKSYSLERLSRMSGKDKIKQTHRALDDSKLLAELLEKLTKLLAEKQITHWEETKKLINHEYFPNRGQRVKVLVTNQVGLNNLYRLITLSHTQRLFRVPCVFRSDLVKHRAGLLIGAAGGREGEMFALFSSFTDQEKIREKMRFYDYVEVNSPESFRYLWKNGKMGEEDVKDMARRIITMAEALDMLIIASHNVHYCEKKEKLLKQIIVANEGMNNTKHYLYYEATWEGKQDRFADLPLQHLLTLEEMVSNWSFLGEKNQLEKILFQNPQKIVNLIGKVDIKQPPLNYSATENVRGGENDLITAYTQRANELFGEIWPEFVRERIEKEWKIIHGRYVFIYWLAYKVVKKTHADGYLVGSRGSIGSSFIAYLCGITDLNPLPFYKFCPACRYTELYQAPDRIFSCYDYQEQENCPHCPNLLTMEGHNLPFETFFGWEGEKSPDIDLNFSGDYQKSAHNYVRQLLGEDAVYRIGTINTLSQQTAEIFFREHLQLRKKLNPNFAEEKWYEEWINNSQIQELQDRLNRLRQEKFQLEKKRDEEVKKI